ncbi:hypothetical protein MVEN_01567500 [Mycena venus]|uniref:Uncharacterized protein n=1 Tax=Mycena venus TaxID=2733690 RepID=A0A8H7CPM5_9AGAR|nr:hypothetical protein MVEN_01567500 [Mycena venus]
MALCFVSDSDGSQSQGAQFIDCRKAISSLSDFNLTRYQLELSGLFRRRSKISVIASYGIAYNSAVLIKYKISSLSAHTHGSSLMDDPGTNLIPREESRSILIDN